MRRCWRFLSFCVVFLPGCSLPGISQTTAVSQSDLVLLDSAMVAEQLPTPSCHASTLVELANGNIMVAWFGGTKEGAGDVAIWSAIRNKSGWEPPVLIARGLNKDKSASPCWNPVLFRTSLGRLLLFYKVGPSPREWWGEMKYSLDEGKTWSSSIQLPDGFLGPVRNKPIQISNGTLLCPSSTESADGTWKIHLEICDSLGQHWRKREIQCDSFSVIQPALLAYPEGRIRLFCRSRNNRIVESWSADNGENWQPLRSTMLNNPNAAVDAILWNGHDPLLVFNPLESGQEWWHGRSKLSVAMAEKDDDWRNLLFLENHDEGEYSYPAMISASDGTIYISYTWQRKNIRVLHLQLRRK